MNVNYVRLELFDDACKLAGGGKTINRTECSFELRTKSFDRAVFKEDRFYFVAFFGKDGSF